YYLKLLRLRKEAELCDYQPTLWEQLTPKEQIILAAYHAHIREEEDLNTLLKIQRYRQEAIAKKKAFYDAKYRAKMSTSIAAETTVDNPTLALTAPTADKTPTNQLVPNYGAHSHLQRELAAAKELQERVKKMQVTTITRKVPMPATPTSTPAPSNIPPQSKDGPRPTKPNRSAMEINKIDKLSPNSLVPIRTRPITPEIKTLLKEEQIKLWAREHVSTWKQYLAIANKGATAGLRALLTMAQKSQKALQQLMENHEIEALVKGWNPWEAKNFHFPALPKKQMMKFKKTNSGKDQSSSSNPINF
ncbi:hypothetical protein PTTG_10911, partial [Puccinia triticina 1-1 BBBD Race 1]